MPSGRYQYENLLFQRHREKEIERERVCNCQVAFRDTEREREGERERERPCKPIPPKFRGCHFTPQILGVECPKLPVLECFFFKFQRVTIRGAQPPARLSEEVCLSEGSAGVSERAPRGLSEGSAGSLRGSAGVRGIFQGFLGVVTLCL